MTNLLHAVDKVTARRGAEVLLEILASEGVEYIFGNPGTTETTFLAAVAASKATYVLALHESSAVGIAAAHLVYRPPARGRIEGWIARLGWLGLFLGFFAIVYL